MIWLAKFTSGQALGMIKPTPGDLGWAMVTAMGILILSVGTVRFLDSVWNRNSRRWRFKSARESHSCDPFNARGLHRDFREIIFRGILIP
jgi:hypothetical protein